MIVGMSASAGSARQVSQNVSPSITGMCRSSKIKLGRRPFSSDSSASSPLDAVPDSAYTTVSALLVQPPPRETANDPASIPCSGGPCGTNCGACATRIEP